MKKAFKKILTVICVLAVMMCVAVTGVTASALAADEIPMGSATIDGAIDDVWEYASEKIAINILAVGDESKNASGWARLMWSKDFIYVLGYVSDNTPSDNLIGDPWNTDSFEFFINEQNKQVTDFKWIDQFRSDRLGRFSGMIAHVISTEAQYKRTFPDIEWATKGIEGSSDYVVEFKIPWKKVEVKAGSKIGVAFQINDDYNNDGGAADGVITSEVTDTFNPKAHMVMKLSSKKAEVPKKSETASKNESVTSDTTTPSKVESTVESNVDINSTVEEITPDETQSTGTPTEDTDYTEETVKETVVERVDSKLLTTVAIAAGAAVLLVAIICVMIIIVTYKKKN